jgi:DNA (cytosine-5)-methyltransferase 1
VLDAQYFGVPQRRRRVFVVAHSSGDSRRAAEVLFEPESLRGDSPKSNRTGKETSYSFTASLGIGSAKVSGTLCALDGPNGVSDQYANEAKLIVMADGQANASISTNEIAPTLNSSIENPIVAYNTLVSETSHCVLASGGQRNDPHTETMIPVLYQNNQTDARLKEEPRTSQTVLARWGTGGGNTPLVAHAFKIRGVGHYTGTNGGVAKPGTGGSGYMGQDEKAYTIATSQDQQIMHGMAVRRLTSTECERLQGFPDGYTDIMLETPDGPRYKALGNSMAVPVMRWIGSRIALATK